MQDSKKQKRTKRTIEPGMVIGPWRVVSHDHDNLFACVCLKWQHQEIRTRDAILSPDSACKMCRRHEVYKSAFGTVYGCLTVVGFVERPSSRKNRPTEVFFTLRCKCGRESTAAIPDLKKGKVTGRGCPGCRDNKLAAAKENNQRWNPSPEDAAEVDCLIVLGVRSVLTGPEFDQIGSDAVSITWVELLQYPNLTELKTDELAANAYRLARRCAVSTVRQQAE
jgi:hypothetical protein